jgi:hypothetical protein
MDAKAEAAKVKQLKAKLELTQQAVGEERSQADQLRAEVEASSDEKNRKVSRPSHLVCGLQGLWHCHCPLYCPFSRQKQYHSPHPPCGAQLLPSFVALPCRASRLGKQKICNDLNCCERPFATRPLKHA